MKRQSFANKNYMTKRIYLILFSCILYGHSYSQEKWVTKYDADWTQILTDSNDFHFFREFQEINSFTSSFVGFRADSSRIEIGFMRYNLLHGKYTSFYKNGTIQYEGEYKDDKPIGKWIENYENGQIKSEYYVVGEDETDYLKKYISYWDSLGNQLIINGKGHVRSYQEGLLFIGDYKDGYLDGELKIYNSTDSLLYIEKYNHGRFINGFNNRNKNSYNSIVTNLSYKDGYKAFDKRVNEFMRKEFKNKSGAVMTSTSLLDYMKTTGAKPNEIDLSSQGFIQSVITISNEGKISSVELIKAKNTLINKLLIEAINKYSNDWISATLRGQAIEKTIVYTFYFDVRTQMQKITDRFESTSTQKSIGNSILRGFFFP